MKQLQVARSASNRTNRHVGGTTPDSTRTGGPTRSGLPRVQPRGQLRHALQLGCLAAMSLAMPLAQAQQPTKVTNLESGQVFSLANADYNGDGLIDIFATGHDPDSEVIWYTQADGTFVASPNLTGYRPGGGKIDRHGCTPADFNLDGRMDFFCSVGASRGNGEGNSELWLQTADGVFTRDAQNHGATDPYGRGRIPVAFGLNKGRAPDLFITNEGYPRPDGEININHVFLNDGKGKFSETPTVATIAIEEATCQGKGDVNHDGRDDLFTCPWGSDVIFYVNNGNNDFDILPLPMADKRWWTARLTRIDDDAFDDLVVTTISGNLQVFINTQDPAQPFKAKPTWQATLPDPHGVAIAVGDLNGDDVPDIYVAMRAVVDFDGGADCASGKDSVDDVVFMSAGKQTAKQGWRMEQLVQKYAGCGYTADYIGQRRVVLSQGGTGWNGPTLVLDWNPAANAN